MKGGTNLIKCMFLRRDVHNTQCKNSILSQELVFIYYKSKVQCGTSKKAIWEDCCFSGVHRDGKCFFRNWHGSLSTCLESKPLPPTPPPPYPHPQQLSVASSELVVGCKILPCTVCSVQEWSVGAWSSGPSPSPALISCVALIKSLHLSE